MTPFIKIKDLTYQRQDNIIIDQCNLRLDEKKMYAVIGPSGVGKTTLLHLLAGFIQPNSGELTIGGESVRKGRDKTSFLFQDLGLFPWQTTYEAVKMPLTISRKYSQQDIATKVDDMLRSLDMLEYKNKYPRQLSGGQKQRVALARTLIVQPDLLLMDEPTSALDAMTKEAIQQLFLTFHQQYDMTCVFVTHDIEEAVFLGDDIIILNKAGNHQVISNKVAGKLLSRDTQAFYDQCLHIRQQLKLEEVKR